jgi:choline dehydrogenase
VLLVEAGEDVGDKLAYQVPAMHALATEDPDMAWWYFVRHHDAAGRDGEDSKATKEGILYPRGSALGGSTAVNAMVTVLPSPSDWNALAETLGEPSFRAVNMRRFEDRVREWLPIELADPSLAASDAKVTGFLSAAAESFAKGPDGAASGLAGSAASLGTLLQGDVDGALRSGETTGIYRLPLATKDGRRHGARERVKETVAEGYPLTVMTSAHVTRVLWDPRQATTAVGVEIARGRHLYGASLGGAAPAPEAREVALAAEEVVLAAGTFNTPQLLMLSGVGDPATLARLGVEVRVEAPGVGQNLQDRYEAAVVSELDAPLEVLAGCALGSDDAADPCLRDWQAGRGVYRTPGFLASVLMRSTPEATLADLQVFAAPTDARGYYPGYSKDSARAKRRFSWLVLGAHTKNRDGEVTLASDDPFARPNILFRSFDERAPEADADVAKMVLGVKFARDVARRFRATTSDPVREIWPGEGVSSDAELSAFVRREAWGHHACCTDRMGPDGDPGAVLDARFRVRGARHLRVVDASVFPDIPGTFIAMPVYMIAEKAADAILEDHK